MMYGVIDLGSNTVRLATYRIKDNQVIPSFSEKETVGLVSYINADNELSTDGINKAIEIVENFKALAKKKKVSKLFVIATAVIRNAKNAQYIINQIESSALVKIHLLSGEEEAYMGLVGIQQEYQLHDGVVVDIGGGSTEVTLYRNGHIEKAISVPLGSLNAYMLYVKDLFPTKKEMNKIDKILTESLVQATLPTLDECTIYGLGGTLNALKKLMKEQGDKTAKQIELKQIKELIKSIDSSDKQTFIELIRKVPERLHTIIPGLVLIKSIFKYFGAKDLWVSKFGIREGYVYHQYLQEQTNK